MVKRAIISIPILTIWAFVVGFIVARTKPSDTVFWIIFVLAEILMVLVILSYIFGGKNAPKPS